jgi:YbbR domain-containing protein
MIKFLRHLVFDDFQLKLFSLALALLFWITVSFAIQQKEGLPTPAAPLSTEVRSFFHIPVLVVSADGDVRNFKVSPSQVEVKVQGDPPIVENLQSKDLRALVDLTGAAPAQSVQRRIEVVAPAGVTLLSTLPQEVELIPPPKPTSR